MRRVIIDASALIAALMANGRARAALLHGDAVFIAPPHIVEETEAALPKIVARVGQPPAVVRAILEILLARVTVIPADALVAHWPDAVGRARVAHAEGDEAYIALALATGAPIWTYDKDFGRVDGIVLISTSELGE